MGRPKKPVDPAVLLKARREAVCERFYKETKITLNEEHKRLIADFVLRERDREQLDSILDTRIRIISGQFSADYLTERELAAKERIGPFTVSSKN